MFSEHIELQLRYVSGLSISYEFCFVVSSTFFEIVYSLPDVYSSFVVIFPELYVYCCFLNFPKVLHKSSFKWALFLNFLHGLLHLSDCLELYELSVFFWIFCSSEFSDFQTLVKFLFCLNFRICLELLKSIFFHVALRDIWITADSGVAEQESRKLPASSSLAPLAPVLESRGPALFWMGSVRAYWLWWISSPNWGSSSYPISGLHPHLPTTVAIVGWSSMLAPSSHTNFVGVLTLKTPTCGYVMVCPNYHFFDLPPYLSGVSPSGATSAVEPPEKGAKPCPPAPGMTAQRAAKVLRLWWDLMGFIYNL